MHTKQPLPSERERDRQEGGVWCGSYQESLSEEREEMGEGGGCVWGPGHRTGLASSVPLGAAGMSCLGGK